MKLSFVDVSTFPFFHGVHTCIRKKVEGTDAVFEGALPRPRVHKQGGDLRAWNTKENQNLPVLAERDWRFSVAEGDSSSGPPKSKPVNGATLGAAE